MTEEQVCEISKIRLDKDLQKIGEKAVSSKENTDFVIPKRLKDHPHEQTDDNSLRDGKDAEDND